MEDKNMAIIIFMIIFFVPFAAIFTYIYITLFPNFELSPWAVILIVLGFILAWVIATYNKFVSLKQKVEQAKGGIDVYLKQRFDLIPNLVETVKGYKAHEEKVMTEITRLRQEYDERNDQDIKQSEDLNNRLTRLLAIVESYPELKASEQFLNLQKMLSKIESQLQAARRIYNSEVTEFNTKRLKFPSNIIGAMFGFKEHKLFEIMENERENVNINI